MIRKSNISQYIDRFLSQELTGDELREFNAERAINPDIQDELDLQIEIDQAIGETEIKSNYNRII